MKDTTAALERLILNFQKLYKKARTAQCLSCDLRNNCAFGQQYSRSIRDVRKVIDPDFERKVHKDCPSLPEISSVNQFMTAIRTAKQLAAKATTPDKKLAERENPYTGAQMPDAAELEEQQAALEEAETRLNEDDEQDPEDEAEDFIFVEGDVIRGTGKSGYYSGDHNGNALCQATEDMINQVTHAQLMIFDLGTKFSKELGHAAKGKFAPVQELSQSTQQANIEKVSEISQVLPSQHGLPDEVFDARLQKKSLIKKQNVKRSTKQKKLYLLIDNSASMGKFLEGSSPFGTYTRGALASMFALSLVRRVQEDKGKVYLRHFTGDVSNLSIAETPEEFEAMLMLIASASYIRGSTHIPGVLEVAIQDIAQSGCVPSDVEILLLTDTEDDFKADYVKSIIGKQEINVLDVSGVSTLGSASLALKSIANKYYKADSNAASLKDIVKIV